MFHKIVLVMHFQPLYHWSIRQDDAQKITCDQQHLEETTIRECVIAMAEILNDATVLL